MLLTKYCSGDKIQKSLWTRHIARMDDWRVYRGFWWGNLRERDHLGDPCVDRRIILRWIFRK